MGTVAVPWLCKMKRQGGWGLEERENGKSAKRSQFPVAVKMAKDGQGGGNSGEGGTAAAREIAIEST